MTHPSQSPPLSSPRIAGVVLCGGKSSRMGRAKAWLPFGDEVLLQRTVRILSEVVAPIVVVAAVGQDLPPLPADVIVARDEHEALGPMGGIAAGLAALRGKADAAFVSACDAPLLRPTVVRRICEALGAADIAVPVAEKFSHPLAAVYRIELESKARALLNSDRLRMVFLWEEADVVQIPMESLRDIDPELDSFRNANTPEEYAAIVRQAF